ncbi:Proteasome subunit beta type-1-A [Thelohanellus kitauei]|uniref:Proteasome subunit beta n=1 Tax=Thelohanellus kitauei TaxID=669202 RepID=A0A0C2MBI1_THEKT|nr:Proteasome subunit beta type-1-A [Thelohanellus kitauei]
MERAKTEFNPYSWNGGSVVAIAGENFVTIASDTRISQDYSIHSRATPKITELSKNLYVGVCGFHGDAQAFIKQIKSLVKDYLMNHKNKISVSSAAQLIGNTLYYRRFFPYYAYVILAGLDEQGKGAVYAYDPVGSFERVPHKSVGSGNHFIQPLLDNQIGLNHQGPEADFSNNPSEVNNFIKDVFRSVSERDIYTGDGGVIMTIGPHGESKTEFVLRHD